MVCIRWATSMIEVLERQLKQGSIGWAIDGGTRTIDDVEKNRFCISSNWFHLANGTPEVRS